MEVVKGGQGALAKLSAVKLAALKDSVRAGEYNLLLGAGISLDASNAMGPLPSGTILKEALCKLTGARASSSLQRVFSGLKPHQVKEHITDRFAQCTPGPTALKFPTFVWRRIFTLNVDNVLEAAFERPGNLQNIKPYHFRDAFEELRTLETVPAIHLHGWSEQPDKGYVFARAEYANIMAEANAWMTVLADIMPVEPFIIGGTTLDEIDVEFYLARRSSDSSRKDRGPSFFVEPYPDAQTPEECARHGLILYHGTMGQFLEEIDELVSDRPPPFNLVAGQTRDLFPEQAPKSVVLSFAVDFERVPASTSPSSQALKFSYGNPPEWSDLAGHWDIGRGLSARVRSIVEAMVGGKFIERLIVILDDAGTGKTTVLRRVGFDLAAAGKVVLDCSALSRLDHQQTTEALDLIDDPLVILVDNLAEQASAIANILAAISRSDVVFICAERNYRRRHIVRSLGDIPHRIIDGLDLTQAEAAQLVESYIKRGMASSQQAIKFPSKFASGLVEEPIAVACCHILSDMRPLDTIVKSTYEAASQADRDRYLIAALAQFCFSGGVRYEVLAARTQREGWAEQFESSHALPLDYFDSGRRNFIIPLNATLAVRTLERAPREDVAKAFERLALGISARVNRDAIRRRAPEARLAGRLFDFEDVIRRFLHEGAGNFYSKVQPAWRWNSRYWEQVSLYHLTKYRNEKDPSLLLQAVQHARHAVAIEPHPFPLTTLGKVLLAQLGQPGMSNAAVFKEAEGVLTRAIKLEHARGRGSVHAYVTLFRGALDYLRLGGVIDANQRITLLDLTASCRKYFPRDTELRELADEMSAVL